MAKKQTRRSISVSRTTYERLKAFCETNNISMSQLVETRVNDFLGPSDAPGMITMAITSTGSAMSPVSAGTPSAGAATAGMHAGAAVMPSAPRPIAPRPMVPAAAPARPVESRPAQAQPVAAPAGAAPPPMTSAAARFAVDPPPPIIKPRQDTAAPKPAEKRPEQIFTF
jgi:hypothetical protein